MTAEYTFFPRSLTEHSTRFTTPQFIKQPFTDRTESNPAAIYVPMNQKRYRLPQAIRQRTIRLTDDIQQTLTQANQIKGEK